VHRLLHEVDHLPTRIGGGKVPEYRHPDPLQKSVADHVREARGECGDPHESGGRREWAAPELRDGSYDAWRADKWGPREL
jgi:hypothetical protein